ncbi:MAG: transposase [Thermoplasmatales archaeon]|nr:MAG: transposase [Thermoplasmatales archaeon]
MFKKNTKHLQTDMFGLQNTMPESLMKHAVKYAEHYFYYIIFCNIKEEIFSILYSDKKSRPNAPINAMVAALLLQNRHRWTYEEVFKNMRFNLLIRMALGLDDLETMPFCPATLFNFQNRLNDHFIRTGENLLETVFDNLTEKQLKELNIKTDIQRTDSTFAASNIRNFSRLQLLVELLIRIYRILSEEDKSLVRERFESYVKKTSGQYIYKLEVSDIPHELEKIAELYLWINQNIRPAYSQISLFKTFERVFTEHFTVLEETVQVKSKDELHSGCIQSPDDLDATYRDKNGKKSKGQVINIVETANPDNPINLITDIVVAPNNKDDSKILNERIDHIKEKTPDLNELHMDGGYGSSENDRKFKEHEIVPVQSDMRGKKPTVPIEIEQTKEDEFIVSCPYQKVKSQKCKKRFKAEFDLLICNKCDNRAECSSNQRAKCRTYYFTLEDHLRKRRLKYRASIPADRLKLRNNVEATVNEFVCRMPKGKLKVRGAFKTEVFAFAVAISSNFGRIYRYITNDIELGISSFGTFFDYFKEQIRFFVFTKIFNFKLCHELAFGDVSFASF